MQPSLNRATASIKIILFISKVNRKVPFCTILQVSKIKNCIFFINMKTRKNFFSEENVSFFRFKAKKQVHRS